MSNLICGLVVMAVALPFAAILLPKLNLYRDALVCGVCQRILSQTGAARRRREEARCRNCRVRERQQLTTTKTVESEESENVITDIWYCAKCKQTVSAAGKSFWLIRGDMMLTFRCTNCKARRDREPTNEEREVIAAGVAKPLGNQAGSSRPAMAQRLRESAAAMRSRHAARRELAAFERRFLADLARLDHLSEVARSEGDWRRQDEQ